jgi:hypothetical protein
MQSQIKNLAESGNIVRAIIWSAWIVSFDQNLVAQQKPDKAVQKSQFVAPTGYSVKSENPTGNPIDTNCICVRNATKKKLFRKRCRSHPGFDPSMIQNPFQEQPLGLNVHETMSTQVRNYETTRQILYQYDFIDGSVELNQAGKAKLGRISQSLFTNFAPMVVENTPRQPGLDHARRLHLVQNLAEQGIPIPPERIVVAGSSSRSITGPEAITLYGKSMSDLNAGGPSSVSGSSSNSVGGLSGSGLLPSTQQSGSSNSGNP